MNVSVLNAQSVSIPILYKTNTWSLLFILQRNIYMYICKANDQYKIFGQSLIKSCGFIGVCRTRLN